MSDKKSKVLFYQPSLRNFTGKTPMGQSYQIYALLRRRGIEIVVSTISEEVNTYMLVLKQPIDVKRLDVILAEHFELRVPIESLLPNPEVTLHMNLLDTKHKIILRLAKDLPSKVLVEKLENLLI